MTAYFLAAEPSCFASGQSKDGHQILLVAVCATLALFPVFRGAWLCHRAVTGVGAAADLCGPGQVVDGGGADPQQPRHLHRHHRSGGNPSGGATAHHDPRQHSGNLKPAGHLCVATQPARRPDCYRLSLAGDDQPGAYAAKRRQPECAVIGAGQRGLYRQDLGDGRNRRQ